MMSRDAVATRPVVGGGSGHPKHAGNGVTAPEGLHDVVRRHGRARYDHQSGVASHSNNGSSPEPVLNETPQEYAKGVGARLKAIRQELGYNTREMAEMIGVERRRYINWEKGRHLPNDERAVIKMCALSDATLDWVYRGLLGKMPYELAESLARRVAGDLPPK